MSDRRHDEVVVVTGASAGGRAAVASGVLRMGRP